MRVVRLTILASLSTLAPRRTVSVEVQTSSARRRVERRRVSRAGSVVICLGGDRGVFFLLAERPDRVPAIATILRSRLENVDSPPHRSRDLHHNGISNWDVCFDFLCQEKMMWAQAHFRVFRVMPLWL